MHGLQALLTVLSVARFTMPMLTGVAMHGLQAVRAAQRSLGEAHSAINHIFHDVVQWKVHGFSS